MWEVEPLLRGTRTQRKPQGTFIWIDVCTVEERWLDGREWSKRLGDDTNREEGEKKRQQTKIL